MAPSSTSARGSLNDGFIYGQYRELIHPCLENMVNSSMLTLGSRAWRLLDQLGSSTNEESRRLADYLPLERADETRYVLDRMLDFAKSFHPQMEAVIRNWAYTEWLLYTELEDQWYRDHVIHAFKVAVIAVWLFSESRGRPNSCGSNRVGQELSVNKELNRVCRHWHFDPGTLCTDEGQSVLIAALWLAGLFHDHGYQYEFTCKLERRLRDSFGYYRADITGGAVAAISPEIIERSFLRSHIVGHAREPVSAKKKRKRAPHVKPQWQARLLDNLTRNHSLGGALNLLHMLDEIVEDGGSLDPRWAVAFELAAEAVLVHDLTQAGKWNPPKPITYEASPLGAILILADELQDWGRPRMTVERSKPNEVTLIFGSELETQSVLKDGIPFEWKPQGTELALPKVFVDKLMKVGKSLEQENPPWEGFVTLEELPDWVLSLPIDG